MRLRPSAAAVGTVGLCALASLVWAAQIHKLDIERDSGRYSLYADTFLDAPPDEIFDVLLDYERFNRISGVYKEFGYLEPAADGTPIVFTRMEGCLMRIYCVSMRRTERLEAERPGHIRTVTLPEQSDFKYSESEWTLEPQGAGTRMIYELVMEPDFWVPPVIGPWYLKRTLSRGGARAIARIERIASAAAAGNADDLDHKVHRDDAGSAGATSVEPTGPAPATAGTKHATDGA